MIVWRLVPLEVMLHAAGVLSVMALDQILFVTMYALHIYAQKQHIP